MARTRRSAGPDGPFAAVVIASSIDGTTCNVVTARRRMVSTRYAGSR